MRLCMVYFTASVVLLSVLITVLAVTTRPPAPLRCTFCGAIAGEPKVSSDLGTWYHCTTCSHDFWGPVRRDFSWADATEAWLEP
jgi:hypothetical protein